MGVAVQGKGGVVQDVGKQDKVELDFALRKGGCDRAGQGGEHIPWGR